MLGCGPESNCIHDNHAGSGAVSHAVDHAPRPGRPDGVLRRSLPGQPSREVPWRRADASPRQRPRSSAVRITSTAKGSWPNAFDASGDPVIIGHVCIEPINDDVAEMAIAVADAWQGRGVGRAMLARAITWAQAHGIARLAASMHCGNSGDVRVCCGRSAIRSRTEHRPGARSTPISTCGASARSQPDDRGLDARSAATT